MSKSGNSQFFFLCNFDLTLEIVLVSKFVTKKIMGVNKTLKHKLQAQTIMPKSKCSLFVKGSNKKKC